MNYLTKTERRIVCVEVLRGNEDAIFERYSIRECDKAVIILDAHRALDNIVNKKHSTKLYSNLKRKVPLMWGYWCGFVVAIMPMALAIAILAHVDLSLKTEADYPLISASATMIGAFAAIVGWMVSSWASYRNARAQHTINFLSSRFSNSQFNDSIAEFNRSFEGRKIDRSLIKELSISKNEEDKKSLQAFRYVLNWFEFISVGVIVGDLDIEIVRRTIRSNLIKYTDMASCYIRECQKDAPKTLEHLVQLRAHFEDV